MRRLALPLLVSLVTLAILGSLMRLEEDDTLGRPGRARDAAGPRGFTTADVSRPAARHDGQTTSPAPVAESTTPVDQEHAERESLSHFLWSVHEALEADDSALLHDLCDALRARLAGLDESKARALLSELVPDQLTAFARVLNFKRHDSGGRSCDLDALDRYPECALPYMLELARGHGSDSALRPAVLYFFEFCRDCPFEVYEVGVQFALGQDDELARVALRQLTFADPELAIGARELEMIVTQWEDEERRLLALQALSRLSTPVARETMLTLVRSQSIEDVALGVRCFPIYFGSNPWRSYEPNPDVEREIILAVDTVYASLQASSRWVAAMGIGQIPSADTARRALEGFATAESDAGRRDALLRASAKVNGPFVDFLQALGPAW